MKISDDRFRRGLRDYRTRGRVIADAIDAPEAYLEPALRLLDDRSELLRWCAIRILTEIGDERAVAPLKKVVADGKNQVEAADALRAITGEDHGTMPAAAKTGATGGTPAETLTDEQIIQAALHDLPAEVSGQPPHYAIRVALPNDRSQDIMVDFSRTDPDGRAIVYLYTACATADPAKFEAVLKLNMIIPYGAIGLASVDDEICFAMVNTYLRETANPRELGFSIMTLAREGDTIEKVLGRQEP